MYFIVGKNHLDDSITNEDEEEALKDSTTVA